MPSAHLERRLAAVLSADVDGYTRLMARDEVGTRAQFRSLFNNVIQPQIAGHHGRIIKTMGDGFLAEFASAIDAVRCAFNTQSELSNDAMALGSRDSMRFRMGINLGDILVEGDDIHGDGVNIADRLQGLARPGSVVVSNLIYEIVRTKTPFRFTDIGPQHVKNVDQPIRAFQLDAAFMNHASSGQRTDPSHHERDKPSIAVMPFANLSDDIEQQYFADGITDDLITDLSNIPDIFVIGRNSTFTFRDKIHDPRDVAAVLRVRYLLEGSVRRAGQMLRINAQLIDVETGSPLWAERFDGKLDDIFALQDKINGQIVHSIRRQLDPGRSATGISAGRDSSAYDCLLLGRSHYYRYTPEAMLKARDCFQEAISIDPGYAEAFEFLSHCHVTAYVFGWSGFDDTLDTAVELAEKSIEVSPNFAPGYARLGWIQGYLREFDAAHENFQHAVKLSPQSAPVLYVYGETMNKGAEPKRALPLLESAYSIDPIVPPSWDFARGHSFILMRRYSEALAQFTSVVQRAPKFLPAYVQLARTHAEMGNVDDARDVIRSITETHGHFSLVHAIRMFPYPVQVEEDRLTESLASGGLA